MKTFWCKMVSTHRDGSIRTLLESIGNKFRYWPNFQLGELVVIRLSINVFKISVLKIVRLPLFQVISEGPNCFSCTSQNRIETLSGNSQPSSAIVPLQKFISMVDDFVLFKLCPNRLHVGIKQQYRYLTALLSSCGEILRILDHVTSL